MDTISWLRQFRVGEYAVFDFAVSFLGMMLVAPLLSGLAGKFHVVVPKKNWVILTLPIGVVTHFLFGNMTPLTKNVLAFNDHYILKAVLIIMFLFGLSGIKIKKSK